MIYPVQAPVRENKFDLMQTLADCLRQAEFTLQDGDVLAVSSKYAAISQGRVVELDTVPVSGKAAYLAERYVMNPHLVELILQESNHVFGGIVHDFNGRQAGFLLTHTDGVVSPNAGLDRSNIPSGKAVLFPEQPYQFAADLRQAVRAQLGTDVGVVLTDSCLMPGRLGTTGVALATAGFIPVRDVRGQTDLFGNAMVVTQIGVADTLAVAAQLVMGETDEATPFAVLRHSGVRLVDREITEADVAIDWDEDIYVGALTVGLLEDGAPTNTPTERHMRRVTRQGTPGD
jgi:coenzyme F420-0:L-glutamate ligase